MKYIYAIFGIVLLFSCVYGLISFNDSAGPPGDNALVVNERSIPFLELQQMWLKKPYHYRDQAEFIDDLVLRELLIQEAITSGIAEEDQFKGLIKDFFEQSLVKTLLDRKQLEQSVNITETDFASFRKAQHMRYRLTLLRYVSYPKAIEGVVSREDRLDEGFAVLPDAIQVRVFSMQPGQLSEPFLDGAEFVRLRLDSVVDAAKSADPYVPEDEPRQRLNYLLQQKSIEEWILQIRAQAIVHYPQQKLQDGGE